MKSNKTMLLLQTIGIIFVVFSHGCSLFLFNDLFPLGSFYMALFAFSSGYFYNESIDKHWLKEGVIKKAKKFLIPYFFWNIVYGIILIIIQSMSMMQSLPKAKLNFSSLFLEPFGTAHQYTFNLAAWFIIALFIVQIIYIILRQIFKHTKFKDLYIMLVSLIIFYICIKFGNSESVQAYLSIFRGGYLLIFYHIGHCYKNYLEKYDIISNFKYFGIILFIQIALFAFNSNIDFLIVWCDFKNVQWFVPIISGITGIAFYLRICKILSDKIGNNKIINLIGTSTNSIMYHHLFVFYCINIVLCLIFKVYPFDGFIPNLAKNDIWYKFYGFN